jgi:hypothetical protein
MDMEGTRTALTVAAHEFQTGVLDNPTDYHMKVLAQRNENNVFVFADNSNIFINAQYQDGGEQDTSIRLSVPRLCEVVRRGRNPRKLFAAGSHGSEGESVWKFSYEKEGFKTYVEPTCNENAVDDVLHAQAMSVLFEDYGGGKLSQTLILLTGDGNENDGRTTFPGLERGVVARRCGRWRSCHGGGRCPRRWQYSRRNTRAMLPFGTWTSIVSM